MRVENFLALLTILSTVTSLCTEGVKKSLSARNINYASNTIVLFVSAIVGAIGMVVFYMYNDIAWTSSNIISIVLMAIANWLVSMVGYDKVVQAINQMKGVK